MSGIGHALGYHARSRLPYQEVFLYNRYADRSYTQASQAAREKWQNENCRFSTSPSEENGW